MLNILKNTFVHIPGVGSDTESKLWQNNILTWNDFLENNHKLPLGESRIEMMNHYIRKSIDAHERKEHEFFINNIPTNLHWRVYNEFKNKCCFLDIETTGLDKRNDDITIIGIYNGEESKIFVKDKNMHEFEQEMDKYQMIVSFNGRCFDVPFIQSKFPDVDLNKFHIDLRFAMKTIGYSGGLKRIEKQVGIIRDDDLQEVDGFEAVRLWYKYKRGDTNALGLLIKYNLADIENLKTLMDFSFEKLKEKTLPPIEN
ncbi:MAG: ribonuclease H-like domain-containing protein [Nanoarchaeota archaeon]|nr:ribonuclease H-like domain-containing protein [Nanoarchaeota archaeon]